MHRNKGNKLVQGLILFLLPACLLLACTTPSSPPVPAPQPNVTDVSMKNLAFVPAAVTIMQGEAVRWTNEESSSAIDHTATSGNPGDPNAGSVFSSPLLHPGQSFTFQFNTPGTYVYFCIVHALVMNGATVTVLPAGSSVTPTPTPTPASTTSMPAMPGM